PFTLATLRYVLGVVLFAFLLVAMEGRQAMRYEGRFVAAAVFGLVGIGGFNLFVWVGLLFTMPEHAAVISALQTPLTALAVWLLRGQRPAWVTLGCVALAILGVVLVVTRGNLTEAAYGGALVGDVLVLLGAICWVSYTFAASYFTGWSALRISALTCIPGLAGLLIANGIAVAAGWARLPTLGTLGSLAWQILYLSLCTVVLGVLGFNNATRKLGPLNAMLMLNFIPVLVFGIEAWLGRSFSAMEFAGAVIVVAALIANNLYLRGVSTRR
ncbi:MAG TPA: DMT family transporter, partial [Burkholderiales bacterium]|nr:DMT family transporter [Burkholderiales bacterium]